MKPPNPQFELIAMLFMRSARAAQLAELKRDPRTEIGRLEAALAAAQGKNPRIAPPAWSPRLDSGRLIVEFHAGGSQSQPER